MLPLDTQNACTYSMLSLIVDCRCTVDIARCVEGKVKAIFRMTEDVHFTVLPLHSKGKFFCQVNQSPRYVHSCLELIILIPAQFDSKGLVWQKIQEPLTQNVKLLGVVGAKGQC